MITANRLVALGMWAIAMLGSLGFCWSQSSKAELDQIDQLKQAIVNFENRLVGMHLRDEQRKYEYWVSKDGKIIHFAKVYPEVGAEGGLGETWIDRVAGYYLAAGYLPAARGGDDFPQFTLATNGQMQAGSFSPFVGISFTDAMFFSQLMNISGVNWNLAPPLRDGQQVLVAKIPERGIYRFTLETAPSVRLLAFEIIKSQGDVLNFGGHPARVGEVDPLRSETEDLAGPLTPYSSIRDSVGPIEYDTHGFPVSILMVRTAKSKSDGREMELFRESTSLHILGPHERTMKSGLIDFHHELFQNAVCNRVDLMPNNGLTYRLAKGRLTQVIDQNAIDRMNITKIRSKTWIGSSAYSIILAVSAIILGLFLWRRLAG